MDSLHFSFLEHFEILKTPSWAFPSPFILSLQGAISLIPLDTVLASELW